MWTNSPSRNRLFCLMVNARGRRHDVARTASGGTTTTLPGTNCSRNSSDDVSHAVDTQLRPGVASLPDTCRGKLLFGIHPGRSPWTSTVFVSSLALFSCSMGLGSLACIDHVRRRLYSQSSACQL